MKDAFSAVSESFSLTAEVFSQVAEKLSLVGESFSQAREKASSIGEKTSLVSEKTFPFSDETFYVDRTETQPSESVSIFNLSLTSFLTAAFPPSIINLLSIIFVASLK